MIRLLLPALLLAAAASPASAHVDPVAHGSLGAGLAHPFSGLDHVLAMVAVGLWAASLGGRALWCVPAAFVGAMAGGFALSLAGVPLPFVEPMIGASLVVLGMAAALALRLPVAAGMALVAVFALFHGAAHGSEFGGGSALSFGLGFGLSTVLLHALGAALGIGAGHLAGRSGLLVPRAAGAATALAGLWLVAGA